MLYILIVLVLLMVIFGPQWWVQRVLAHNNQQPEENFPGTGGQLARHLLDKFGLEKIAVEPTEAGDHYDPVAQVVRLTQDKFEGRTLTAITVATHEVGHALQHAAGERLFAWRTRLAIAAAWGQKLGSFLLFIGPVLVIFLRAPVVGVISFLGAFLILGLGILVQFLTLPVEIDASFNKALPILKDGYLEQRQYPAAEQILRAAAWTYVAGSLASLLNFWRWMQILRR